MTHQHYILIAELLSALEQPSQGFAIGVDVHMKILQVLENEVLSEDELKLRLAPIIAKSKEEQLKFYQLFEDAKQRIVAREQEKTTSRKSLNKKLRNWLIFAALLLVGTVLIIWGVPRKPVADNTKYIAIEMAQNQCKKISLDTLFTKEKEDKLQKVELLTKGKISQSKVEEINQDTAQKLIIETLKYKEKSYTDTFVLLRTGRKFFDTLWVYVNVTSLDVKKADSYNDIYVNPAPDFDTLPYKNYHREPSLETLKPQYKAGLDFSGSHLNGLGIGLRVLLLLLLLALGLGLWKWWQKRLKKEEDTVLKTERPQVPPFTWELNLQATENVRWTDAFYLIANQLRRRSESERWFLNIPKTIQKSIEKGGLIKFQFKAGTQSNDYLVLLDINHSRNHRALLYDLIIKQLAAHQVHVERFYYNRDLRLCWNEQYPEGIRIADVQHRFSTYRLLIFGSAAQLLSTKDGTWAAWSKLFDAWRQKVILTTKPIAQWDKDEATLASKFLLLPATLSGMLALVEQLEADDKPDFLLWKKRKEEALRPINLPEKDIVQTLQSYFDVFTEDSVDERLSYWIAACAIFPQLNFELTLHLGAMICPDLLNTDNLFKINRLQWFQVGEIPTEARKELLAFLRKEQPDLERKVRQSIQMILDNSAPPEGSAAAEEHQMRRLENQLMLILPEEKAQRLKLRRQIKALDAKQDALVAEQIEKEEAEEEKMKAPTWLQRNSRWMTFLWAVFYVALFIATVLLAFFWNPRFMDCSDCTMIEYKNERYAIENAADYMTFMTNAVADLHLAPDSVAIIEANNTAFDKINEDLQHCDLAKIGDVGMAFDVEKLLKNLDTIKAHAPEKAQYLYHNIAIEYYNSGMAIFNSQRDPITASVAADYFYGGLDFVKKQQVAKLDSLIPDFENMIRLTENLIEYRTDTTKILPKEINKKDKKEPKSAPTIKKLSDIKRESKLPDIKMERPGLATIPTLVERENGTAQIQYSAKDLNLEMVFVQGGTFMMGSDEKDAYSTEKPQHKVTVPSFYIGKYEVTQKQWREVMGKDPDKLSFKGCDDCPVEGVNWDDIQDFLAALNKKFPHSSGRAYRLPSEAEWEYAARGGVAAMKNNYIYAGSNNIDEVAWYYDTNSEQKTHPVGKKKPNSLGIYDMSGNVWEWCQDTWHKDYNGAPDNGSAWEGKDTSRRVLRGGSWGNGSNDCRVSDRDNDRPDYRNDDLGFRFCLGY